MFFNVLVIVTTSIIANQYLKADRCFWDEDFCEQSWFLNVCFK